MLMRLSLQRPGWLTRLFLVTTLLILPMTPSWALAQSSSTWILPQNLSHSGIAMNPAIVTDQEGVVHVVWQDDLANFVYAAFEGNQWSEPEATNLNLLFRLRSAAEIASQAEVPVYTGPNPLFVPGPGQDIFAFWISPEDKLFTSRVKNTGFKHAAAWDPAGLITPKLVSFAVAVDARGEWHLAFLRTAVDTAHPAGIYYTHSTNGGRNWPVPVLLYDSPYLRTLGAGEGNLSIATGGTEDAPQVYVAWDNRPRKQVLFAQSADGGVSWGQPVLIAGPAPDSGLAGPFNIQVGADKQSAVRIWQDGRPDGACTQFYQSSNNAGATWSELQPMLEGLTECPHSIELMAGSTDNPRVPPRLYLLAETQSQVLLAAWNGLQWSEPQAQPMLSEFEDPEIYTEIDYGCHRSSLFQERLYVVGCDQGGGGDIWVTSRSLGTITSWFTPPVWSQPLPVADDPLKLRAIELMTTQDDFVHAFFSQPQDSVIYYTYWNGDLWSRVTPVLKLPDGDAGLPAAAAGPGNELLVVAPNKRGALYFSRATSGNATTESQWSTPARLGMVHDGEIGSADVTWDGAGTAYVAYSVPVNEERGIYLLQSKDHGTSWSEPLEVFDGAAAGFDVVGAPSLLASSDGVLHLIWQEQSIRGDGVSQPLSIYYARSEDGGRTFSDPQLAVEEAAGWQEIAADGNGILHLFWQAQDTATTVWDQVSSDGGRSWQFPQGLASAGKTAAVTADSSGQLHLMTVSPGFIDHWRWDGSRWHDETPVHLSSASEQDSPPEVVAAAANKQGKMVVVVAVPTGAEDTEERSLLYSTRMLQLPSSQAAVQETPTLSSASPTSTLATPTSEPLVTPTPPVENQPVNLQGQDENVDSRDPVNLFVRALLPVALLLLAVLSIVIWRASRARDE